MRDKVIIAFVLRGEKGQGQSRAQPGRAMVNSSPRVLRGKGESCKHRPCLASLFGRRVIDGVSCVFLACARGYVPASRCKESSACLYSICLGPRYLVCGMN